MHSALKGREEEEARALKEGIYCVYVEPMAVRAVVSDYLRRRTGANAIIVRFNAAATFNRLAKQ